MNRFIRVCELDSGDVVLINMNYVKVVRRVDREERADIIEDCNGKMYECCHDYIFCPSVKDCIVEL